MASTASERFHRHVDRSGEHHLWTGALHPQRGTGRLKVLGRQVTAHRYAWELAHGPLPEGARVTALGGGRADTARVVDAMTTTNDSEVLTIDEAAALLRISRNAAYAAARQWRTTGGKRGLPCIEIGRTLRVPRAGLVRLLAEAPQVA